MDICVHHKRLHFNVTQAHVPLKLKQGGLDRLIEMESHPPLSRGVTIVCMHQLRAELVIATATILKCIK